MDRARILSLSALIAVCGVDLACGKKKKHDDGETGETGGAGTGSTAAGGSTLVMAGTVMVGTSLTDAGAPAAIVAVPLYKGAPDSQKVGASIESPIGADGTFAAGAATGEGVTDAVF